VECFITFMADVTIRRTKDCCMYVGGVVGFVKAGEGGGGGGGGGDLGGTGIALHR